ncbi:MAG: 5-(carboxyamino)imidazole ribonucleotide synthase [Flavobacteriaceae bacterium]|nr:5-(carboxyamino)imidazole ribonucleotide synthase [Flavobacteriaceae bacterium]MCY4267522.1 5-(carboxyamino)imidazole ribonucleotide synthase [Flavobacteriaceae bacterium]MCY4299708.1 5-(carboxyamino)imidazole ribonucleotide synthase [Flavobacteriaceae bacterium]
MLDNFPKIGILGGGQLGKMLLSEAHQWSLPVTVMDSDVNAVCKQVCHDFVHGDLLNYHDVMNFGSKVDVVTIEIEKVNLEALKKLEQNGKTVIPQPSVLEIIQNKVKQKQFYKKHQIATSRFQSFDSLESLKSAILNNEMELPLIWKAARFGYDGYGVKKIDSLAGLDSLDDNECLTEELVDLSKELSVIVCRTPSGDTSCFPVVEMEFNSLSNQVEYILCPARVSKTIENQAIQLALKVSESFQHYGLLAIELFLDKNQNLMVNEVAPRPHNSGHWSIEGAYSSQYQQHLSALLDLPLKNTSIKSPSVMVNLVGKEGYSGPVVYENLERVHTISNAYLHLYGKEMTRPNRKMGHITILNQELNAAYHQAQKLKQQIQIISN